MIVNAKPLIKCEQLTLCDDNELTGQAGIFEFTQDVCWLREASATVALYHGGQEIREIDCFSDHLKFLDCIDKARNAYDRTCELFGIARGSTLEACITLDIIDVPYALAPLQGFKPESLRRFQSPIYFLDKGAEEKGMILLEPFTILRKTPILTSLTHLKSRGRIEAQLRAMIRAQRVSAGVTTR
ncbi:MAG: hypothetical protein V7693_15915 [Halopseudomonas sabulinigri]